MWKTFFLLAIPACICSFITSTEVPVCDEENEVYDLCANGGCRRWYCSEPGILCIDPFECEGGCICKNDYARNSDGVCIPEDQCDQCPNPHEVYSNCYYSCPPQTCDSIGLVYHCPLQTPENCVPECVCEEGYYRNVNGDCVSQEDCEKCKKPHEYYSNCSYSCPPQTCDTIGEILFCPRQTCRTDCVCENGYYRNAIDDCVSKEDCEKCPGPNEYFSCGGACDNVCATLNKQNQTSCPIINIKCNPMCYCAPGFARNNSNICIPIDDCPPPLCPADETYVECPGNSCEPQTCDQLDYPSICDYSDNSTCPGEPGCVCDYGNVRDSTGKCIPRDECPPSCGDNEIRSSCANGGCRRRTCADPGILCIDPIKCVAGCICADGYVKNDTGDCIPEDQCEQCYKPHEVYSNCSYSCPPQTCDSFGLVYPCPFQSPEDCVAECRCEEGYYRNAIGNCVSQEVCEKCPGPNEYFDCGGACDNVCATLNIQSQKNCSIVNEKCNPMCYCAPGYARNSSNICVPIKQCPASTCEGINEVWTSCLGAGCKRWTCSHPYVSCTDPFECNYGCTCDYNHVRNDDGVCVPEDQCPPITPCGDNEIRSPCANGGCRRRTCSDSGILCTDPIKCVAGCICAHGYVKNDTGNCIPEDQCASTCEGINEVWTPCAGSGCKRWSCLDPDIVCVESLQCVGGCDCADGYVRNNAGVCIPEDQCETCNKPHEVYSNCSYSCPPQTCESINGTYNCPLQTCDSCVAECRCEEGYYRNAIGNCVSQEDCELCPGPNEYFDCNGACDNVCATLNIQNQTYCPYVNKKCNPMCYCAPGYARNSSNICIPIDECPAQCADDEIYDECPETSCKPLTCDQLGFPVNCELSDTVNCPGEPACVCNNDNVRDDTGQCIPKDQCPSCGGDVNAKPGCGNHCGQTCTNRGGAITACPQFCIQNGCDCKEGYLYDDNVGKCVLPCNCNSENDNVD